MLAPDRSRRHLRGDPDRPRNRAVVILPNGFTLASLFFGVFAIVSASRGEFDTAGLYIVFGGVCDALDGRVARATGTGSRFGSELDSLVDAITFGLAPAMIMYFAVLNRNGWDWIFSFLFVACACIRLARFNVEQAGRAKKYFHGLPSPAAGMTLATYYWFSQTELYNQTILGELNWTAGLRGLMLTLAFLMISNVSYPAVPTVGFKKVSEILGSLVVATTFIGVLFIRKEFYFPALITYVLYGLAKTVIFGLLDKRPVGDSPVISDDDAVLDPETDPLEESEETARQRTQTAPQTPPTWPRRYWRLRWWWTNRHSPFPIFGRRPTLMARFRLAVRIVPRKGLLDPQGKAVSDALHTLGFDGVGSVHVGRYIVIETNADDGAVAGESVKEMCRKLLANPVTEDFEVEPAVPA